MKINIIITMEGGQITSVMTDSAINTGVRIIDYDTEGLEEGDTVQIPQLKEGDFAPAYIYESFREPSFNPDRVRHLYAVIK